LSNPLRVWMIIPTYYPVVGGAQTQVDMLSRSLLEDKREVRVLARRHSYAHPAGLSRRDSYRGVPIHRVCSRGGTRVGSALYLLLGLCHLLGAAGWIAVVARRLCGGRAVIKMRTGRAPYEALLSSPLRRWSFLPLLRLADRIVVVNGEVEQLMLDLGIHPGRVVRIPNGVDMTSCQVATPEQKQAARNKLDLPANTTVFLYVGRLEALKRVDLAIRAWARLSDSARSQARFLVVGGGPEYAALDTLIERLGLGKSVFLLGERRDVEDFYHAADVFVLPSATEGLSNALMEAMAFGLAVIASRVGGAVDVIEEPVSGFLFENGSDAELAIKLARLIEQPGLCQSVGLQAREKAASYADFEKVFSKVRHTCLTLASEVQPTSLNELGTEAK